MASAEQGEALRGNVVEDMLSGGLAPKVSLTLRSSHGLRLSNVTTLVDTGFVGELVITPLVAESLGLVSDKRSAVMSIIFPDGRSHLCRVWKIFIQLANGAEIPVNAVQVADGKTASRYKEAILGMEILRGGSLQLWASPGESVVIRRPAN